MVCPHGSDPKQTRPVPCLRLTLAGPGLPSFPAGSILLDGRDLLTAGLRTVRTHVAVIPQVRHESQSKDICMEIYLGC